MNHVGADTFGAKVMGMNRHRGGLFDRGRGGDTAVLREHNLALVNILKIVEALSLQPSEFFRGMDAPPKKARPPK